MNKNNILECFRSPEQIDKKQRVDCVVAMLEEAQYSVVEVNADKPWGAYIRLSNNDAERFIQEFFPSISFEQAQLGDPEAELSPKILIVEPGKRLSWQKHARRAECWTFLTAGCVVRSDTDIEREKEQAKPGDFVQLQAGERHRLIGGDAMTVVAEIWQHTDRNQLSDEDDIVRIQDDYHR